MDSIELEASSGQFKATADDRPLIPVPPPVRLVAIDDVHLPAANGLERALNDFYVGRLKFLRKAAEEDAGLIIFYAENHRICFDPLEPPIRRDSVRPIGIEVQALEEIETSLIEDQIEHVRQVGLLPGEDSILLRDPAGNWITILKVQFIS